MQAANFTPSSFLKEWITSVYLFSRICDNIGAAIEGSLQRREKTRMDDDALLLLTLSILSID